MIIGGLECVVFFVLIIPILNFLPSIRRRERLYRFPPGPRGIPIIGNIMQIPTDRQWKTFDYWIKKYGDIVGFSVMGQPSIVVGSVQAAIDLLDTRGTIYSDRPAAIMAGELVGWDRGLGYASGPYNPRFREFRRLFHYFIGPRPSQEPVILLMQEHETRRLLYRLMRDPKNFISHMRQSSGALILRLAFGYKVNEDVAVDPLVKIAEDAMDGFSRASAPGAFLIDSFPILRYVPQWAPGGGFWTAATKMRKERERLYEVPYSFVKEQMSAGIAERSFVSAYLEEKGSPTDAEEEFIKAAAASLYSGGADTTPSSLTSFILAMTLHPYIQIRAQAELDAVIGRTFQRLPSFTDRQNLPYINAIVLELFRWNPAVPLGLAHRLTKDDVYGDYYLPKGTVVWANIWSMLHDEAVFPEPMEFRPERFLDEVGSLRKLERAEDPFIGFGFGRRICPGMFIADNTVFIAVACMLYVFNIRKSTGLDGEEIIPEIQYDGFICHPRPFHSSIITRSKEAADLINGLAQED